MACVRALALAAVVAAAVSAAARAPGAQAQRSCWGEAVREWVRIGYVRDDHPLRCYREALARVDEKTDLAVYSDLSDSIRSALAAAVARAAGEEAPPRSALEVRRASSRSAVAAAPRPAAPLR